MGSSNANNILKTLSNFNIITKNTADLINTTFLDNMGPSFNELANGPERSKSS